jgi:pyruvate dehydrogenase (quinone)
MNGLFDCFRNRVPVLAIAAHIPSPEIGTSYFQEMHPDRLFPECSKYCEVISTPEQMPHIFNIAIQTAVSLRTVSVIIISGDVAMQPAPDIAAKPAMKACRSLVRPPEKSLNDAAKILNNSKSVAILGGAGCAGAHSELVQIAEKLKSPIVHTMRGKEYIEYDNPYDVGMTGLIGFSSGYHAMMNCETLLILGADFPYRQFLPEEATIIQVDSRSENIGRRCHVDLGLTGDVKETLSVLNEKIGTKTNRDFLDAAVKHYQKARQSLDDLATGAPGKKPIHPQFVAKMISDLAPDDAIFTCDVGTPTIWAARYLKMNGKRRLLGSFSHGSMANAIPQAIGATTSHPGRQAITLSGDGGLSMLMGELLTLRQAKLPVKVVVFNNGCYGFVELEMKAAGILEFATQLDNPNFAKMAEAIGIMGIRVEEPQDLESALKRAFKSDGPALVEVLVNRQELSMPPKIDLKHALGFNLWVLKAVLNGRGDAVVDLVKTNLLRN